MCTTVFTEEKTVKTVGKLRELLGQESIIELRPSYSLRGVDAVYVPATAEDWKPLEAGDCLCWVDVPASAEKAGWVAEHDDFGYRLRKR